MWRQLKTLIQSIVFFVAIVYRRSLSTGSKKQSNFDGTAASLLFSSTKLGRNRFWRHYHALISVDLLRHWQWLSRWCRRFIADNRESCLVSGEPALSGESWYHCFLYRGRDCFIHFFQTTKMVILRLALFWGHSHKEKNPVCMYRVIVYNFTQ